VIPWSKPPTAREGCADGVPPVCNTRDGVGRCADGRKFRPHFNSGFYAQKGLSQDLTQSLDLSIRIAALLKIPTLCFGLDRRDCLIDFDGECVWGKRLRLRLSFPDLTLGAAQFAP
jgi:hypothetical protein